MQARHEKVIYENDKGQRIEIAYSFPYFYVDLEGKDGLNVNISKTKSPGQDGSTIDNVNLDDRPLRLLGSNPEIQKRRNSKIQSKITASI